MTDSTARRDVLLALIIVVVGGWFRFQHLDAGIPHAVGIDEPQIMERAVAMMKTGDFNPRFFDWPSLTIYLQLVVACVTFLAGAMKGLWNNLNQVGPADMYLNGRMLTATLGTATIWLVYLTGSRWGRPAGLIAAALFAVVPYHVRESHYVLADVPTAFLTTLAFWLALVAAEQPTRLRFALAGAAAGLAASAKYNGLVVILLPLAIAWLRTASIPERLWRTTLIAGAAAAAFVVGTPYAVFDLPTFLNDYARLAAIFAREGEGTPGWAIYLRHLQLALGTPALWLTGIGLVGAIWRTIVGPDRVRWLALVLFPVVYFKVMAGSYQIYGRYLMPLLPFAAVLAATAITTMVARLLQTRLRPRLIQLAGAALIVAAVAVPLRATVDFTRTLGRETTMDLAHRWVQDHVAPGAKVVIEAQAFQLPGTTFSVTHVPSLVARTHDDYAADQIDYLIASAAAYGAAFSGTAPRETFVAYQTLFTHAEQVAHFPASSDNPGPELRIFRIRR